MISQNVDFEKIEQSIKAEISSLENIEGAIKVPEMECAFIIEIYRHVHKIYISHQECDDLLKKATPIFSALGIYCNLKSGFDIIKQLNEVTKIINKVDVRSALSFGIDAVCRNFIEQSERNFPSNKHITDGNAALLESRLMFNLLAMADQEGDEPSDFQIMWWNAAQNPEKVTRDYVKFLLNLEDEFLLTDEQGYYIVHGDVLIDKIKIQRIPIKFSKVYGDFICTNIDLIDFENFPKEISGELNISGNRNIKSFDALESIKVGGSILANNTWKITLKFRLPKSIRNKIIW